MKKSLMASLAFASVLLLSACGSSSTTKTTKETTKTEAVASASAQKYADPSTLKDSYDVIIVGSGGAGLSAAIQAKEAGKNPVILEKMATAGGNTTKSSAGMNASQTKFQEAEGIKDSNDKFYEESLKGGHGTNNPDLLHYLVDNSASAIDWLDSMGITLSNLTTTGGMSEKRTHRPADGSAVGEYLVAGLFVNAVVNKVNEKDGKVTGVNVTIDGKEKTIASNAVVLTTGGFGANMQMVTEYKPELNGFVTTNQKGSTGDGIVLAKEIGAATVDMGEIQIHPTVEQSTSTLISESVRGEGAILVNQDGKRFFNEMETRDKVSQAIIGLPEKYAYLILDNALTDRAKAVKFYQKRGLVKTADTVEGLAKEIGVPAENLKATLEAWNKAVADKKDSEFGRSTAMDHDLTTGPFHAIQIAPGIHHTMGGLKINTNAQVLKEDGSVINGLYAAGEVTGGVHGANRIGGNAVADIIIFGRQAGAQAAASLK